MRTLLALYNNVLNGIFPDHTAKPATTPTAKDGTPLKAINIDDLTIGWIQALFFQTGNATPNGNPELKDDSQIIDLMRQLFSTAEKQTIAAAGPVVFGPTNHEVEVDLTGGNLSIDQLPVPDFIGQRIDFVGVGSGICDIASGNGVTNLGIEFGETEGVSFVSVEKSLALVWELTIDRATTCKAWVNFDGSGVISIRDSFNVSSITDVGAGNYTINYTNNMKTPDYSAVCLCSDSFSSTTNVTITSGSVFVGSINIQTRNAAGTAGDPNIVTLQVFGL